MLITELIADYNIMEDDQDNGAEGNGKHKRSFRDAEEAMIQSYYDDMTNSTEEVCALLVNTSALSKLGICLLS